MKRIISCLLAVLMTASVIVPLGGFSVLAEEAEDTVEELVISYGKEAYFGKNKVDASLVTDASTDASSYFDTGRYGENVQDRANVSTSGCYFEVDLGSEIPLSSINVVTYYKDGRIYHWDAYGSCDNDLPISEWTFLGGKITDEASTVEGYTLSLDDEPVRYLRIYGTYNNKNNIFHVIEISAYAKFVKRDVLSGYSGVPSSKDALVVDGSLTSGHVDISWGSNNSASSAFGLDGKCFYTIDLGASLPVSAVNFVGYYQDSRYYHFAVYGSDDDSLPANDWVFLAQKDNSVRSTTAGFTVTFPKTSYRYLRIYGLYSSANVGFHFVEISAYVPYSAANGKLSYKDDLPAVVKDGKPVTEFFGMPEKYTKEDYSFALRVNDVLYSGLQIDFTTLSGELLATADWQSAGFAPTARIVHTPEIIVYHDGKEESVLTLPTAVMPDEAIEAAGYALELFSSLGSAEVHFDNGTYTLTASGAFDENTAFDGWYLNGEKVSGNNSFTYVPEHGSDDLIVCLYDTAKPYAELSSIRYNAPAGSSPSLTYDLYNGLAGSANGTVSFTPAASDSYSLVWLDEQGCILSRLFGETSVPYSPLAEFDATAGTPYVYCFQPFTAIPYGAKSLAVLCGTTTVSSVTLPEEKLISEDYNYSYGVISDLHYNSFSYNSADAAVEAVNNAYAFFANAGVHAVFETGDYSANGERSAYEKHAAAVVKSGLLVLSCAGNHEAWYTNSIDYMYGTNGIWRSFMNPEVYAGTLEGLEEVAPNGIDFTYRIPGGNDLYVFVSQILWDNKEETQPYLIAMETLQWLKGVFEANKNDRVHLFLHTYLPDDDDENVDGEGDITNLAGYGYHYHFNQKISDGQFLRALLDEYENVIWYNGHSHWVYAMQKYNINLNIYDYNGTTATMIHVPSVTAPRTVSDYQLGYTSNAGTMSQGALTFVGNDYEIMNGVDLKNGQILSYACYIIYTDKEDVVESETIADGVSYVFDRQTATLSIIGQGDMPNYDERESVSYADFASETKSVYVARGVTSIGKNAFSGFSALEKVEIKDSVCSIGDNAFENCSSLEELIFSDTVKTVGTNAFSGAGNNLSVRFDGTDLSYRALLANGGNDALENAELTFTKYQITFLFGDIRISYEVKKGDIPEYTGEVYNGKGEDGKAYDFVGWGNGTITYVGQLPAATQNAVYIARFEERDGGVITGQDKYTVWTLDRSKGILTLSGMGPMPDYAEVSGVTTAPWGKYHAEITKIVLDEFVFTLGKNAFSGLEKVKEIIFGSRMTFLHERSLSNMNALESLYLPSSIKGGGKGVITNSPVLTAVYYAGSEKEYLPVSEKFASAKNNAPLTCAGGLMVYGVSPRLDDTFSVKFLDDNGSLIEECIVLRGKDATPPSAPQKEGEYFLGWSGSYRNITSDTEIYAIYGETPDSLPTDVVTPAEAIIYPLYGKIENYGGGAAFIVAVSTKNNTELFDLLRIGAMKLQITITDEDAGRQYIIDDYRFTRPGYEFYGSSFLRLYTSPYGLTPKSGTAYTLSFTFYSYKNVFYTGTCAKGAFTYTGEPMPEATVTDACRVICTTHDAGNDPTADCEKGFTCVYCGETVHCAHTPVVIPGVEASENADGISEGVICAVCGKILVEQETISRVKGDANLDGIVNISDVTAILDRLSCTGEGLGFYRFDVNRDGILNISDVTAVLDILSK